MRGENCPLCREIASGVEANAYFTKIRDLRTSQLRLAANQCIPGYCVLVHKKHVREPYELDAGERALFFEDMMTAAQALEQVFAPMKMNFVMNGISVPHLHCHILPRFRGDPWPHAPARPTELKIMLSRQESEDRAERIRAALR